MQKPARASYVIVGGCLPPGGNKTHLQGIGGGRILTGNDNAPWRFWSFFQTDSSVLIFEWEEEGPPNVPDVQGVKNGRNTFTLFQQRPQEPDRKAGVGCKVNGGGGAQSAPCRSAN